METADISQPSMVRMSKSQMNTMLITFLDVTDTFHFEFIAQGPSVNQDYYVEIRKRLREAVRKKDPNFGSVIESSTITMLQLTRRSLSGSFWSKIDH
jgi:hypothetical protein